MKQHYDYIFTGTGGAALSLLYRMLNDPFFSSKKILLLDKDKKNLNDRTWCFWEKGNSVFENIVFHAWPSVNFYTNNYSAEISLAPYTYKMVRGIDLYQLVLDKATLSANITVYNCTVLDVRSSPGKGIVETNTGTFSAEYVFNSVFKKEDLAQAAKEGNCVYLQQHFKGWMIETEDPYFDSSVATFMDFRVSQEQGTTFVYVLPVNEKKALIEYTLFSKDLLPQDEYDAGLKSYISDFLKLKNYSITEKEFGVIPMTDFRFSSGNRNIVNIGTAGGQTKASSGFTFRFMQKHAEAIVTALKQGRSPLLPTTFYSRRFDLYDRTLLKILFNNKMKGSEIFETLFRKNPVERVLKFLDNETNLSEELKLMNTVPIGIFLPVALREIFRM